VGVAHQHDRIHGNAEGCLRRLLDRRKRVICGAG
jgi:hypothetical protein